LVLGAELLSVLSLQSNVLAQAEGTFGRTMKPKQCVGTESYLSGMEAAETWSA
jgi:hypothetical protein